MIHACNKSERHVNIFNIGSSDTITVNEIAKIVLNKMGIAPEISYTGGSKGWLGDIPAMLLSMEKMNAIGFIPKYNSRESIELTLDQIL
jgi:UDP-glucose 4-epimerase